VEHTVDQDAADVVAGKPSVLTVTVADLTKRASGAIAAAGSASPSSSTRAWTTCAS
jgi:hypothetical protein